MIPVQKQAVFARKQTVEGCRCFAVYINSRVGTPELHIVIALVGVGVNSAIVVVIVRKRIRRHQRNYHYGSQEPGQKAFA